MTLLYMDGFDLQDAQMRWGMSDSVTSGTAPDLNVDLTWNTATRFGSGKCMTFTPNKTQSNFFMTRSFTPSAVVYIGAAVQVMPDWTGLSISEPTLNLFGLCGDSGATGHLYLRRSSSNAILLYRGDPTTGNLNVPSGTLLASSPAGVLDSNWRYIEMSATINATTGSVTVKVDGTTVITFTGNTKNGGTSTNIDTVKFRSGRYTAASPIAIFSVDDLYICDGLGSVNNTFLGDVRVQSMVPNAAGSSTQLTPTGSANNYANAGEVPYNDSTYNGSATSGQRDTYNLSDLASGTAGIVGIQTVAHMQKSDSGTANAKVALKSGASVYYDNTVALASVPTVYSQVRETDPATSAAWTVAAANALEAGMEVV